MMNALRLVGFCGLLLIAQASNGFAADRPPNIVLVFCDDLGYADIGAFGAKGYQTPNLDRLAAEGVRCTDFQVAAAVCSASRAALLTGCYPQRVGILGALGPAAKLGIAKAEKLLPEYLKDQGYATAIFGKWHLGHHPQFLPQQNGFDRYFGLPYSNDMWPKHPTAKNFPPLPLFDGDKTVEHDPDQTQLTTWYTERAVKFIEEHAKKPFFVYLPHSMPHVPLFVSDKYKGKSEQGLFGDVISEIDWSVGQILAALKKLNLDEQTLVLFTSDNGPWLSYGNHAGSAGIFREGKGTTWEGGHRVPFVARWPGKIPAGKTCTELCSTIDVLPTCVKLAGGTVSADRKLDGKDVWPLWSSQPGAKSPHEAFYYYWDNGLDAVRSGEWKLHFPHAFRSLTGKPGKDGMPDGYTQGKTGLALYNLKSDPGETTDVAAANAEVLGRLQQLAEVAREDLGDSLTKRMGKNRRSADKLSE
ncbi:sulfatase [Anatilimnocola sp. NA78]|uniref:sulfatase family protein n=1 Tax=Anatilimnocola sp. NA78 TaxID=3415683 RepID=UPI003CE5628F